MARALAAETEALALGSSPDRPWPSARTRFTQSMSDPVPIPEAGIARAVEILRTNRPFRYGEDTEGGGEVARLEADFAAAVGRRFVAAVSSCGCALFLALRALGIKPGDPVLCSGFTLAPVPGAIDHAFARPVLVDITGQLTIDLEDLEAKAAASRAKVLLLSHMRGHVGDMPALMAFCERQGITVIEDCAHTLGACFDGRPVGTFGRVACFSSQTFKHLNSGEGGLLATDDPELAARAIVMSGSYMMYHQNGARPGLEAFEPVRDSTPNFSMRMTEVDAALIRPQLALLEGWVACWNRAYHLLDAGLVAIPHLRPIARDPRERFVGSSIQFLVEGLAPELIGEFVRDAAAHGVFLKWFGAPRAAGFTSRYDQWGYAPAQGPLPMADRVLRRLIDMRVALSFDDEACATILGVLGEAMAAATAASPRGG